MVLSSELLDTIENFKLRYDRRNPIMPSALEPYTKGVHHLYLRQIPSALTVKGAGHASLSRNKEVLVEEGFPLLHSLINQENATLTTAPVEDIPYVPRGKSAIRTTYEDPFLVLAGYMFANQRGLEQPEIRVWAGDCRRITNKLPGRYFNLPDMKNALEFSRVKSHDAKMHFIWRHTHWGHYIWTRKETGRFFYVSLYRRINAFLRGKVDTTWKGHKSDPYKNVLDPERLRNQTERARRLIEVLKTVDGMFLQRFISFPEETWTWEKYDAFVVQGISILLTDEFFDGQITPARLEQKSCYAVLKSSRKTFKKISHSDAEQRNVELFGSVPHWVQCFFIGAWKAALRCIGHDATYVAGVLSQTRGAGTPPPIVILQSKLKFLRTVSEVPKPLTGTERALISKSIDLVLNKLPDSSFTGLATKARVTITGAACWEATRKEGGTAQAVLDIMSEYDEAPIPIRDLDDNTVVTHRHKADFDSVGEAVFWACLDKVLNTELDDLRKAFLTVVREPGKGRSVTKGKTALKIVLDTVSKICSSPLRKGVESSHSGMGKSHHGWNFFLDMTSEGLKEEIFSIESVEEEEYEDYIVRHIVWEDVYLGSTDYQEATDQMHLGFAEIAGTKWMKKCGIPPVLQGIVRATCYKPRRVYYTGTGALANIGQPSENLGQDVRYVTLNRGVLMGDPLTKVVLHMSNITARSLAEGLLSGAVWSGFSNANEARSVFERTLGIRSDV